jgi:hypothetical protein
VELTTVGGIVQAPRVQVAVDGILGIDFFLGRKLTIDFRIGLVTLE